MFVELKKTMKDDGRAEEQLRRSLAYLKYICSMCRLEDDAGCPATQMIRTQYVLIGRNVHPNLRKRRYPPQMPLLAKEHDDIVVSRFVGSEFRFEWLQSGPVAQTACI